MQIKAVRIAGLSEINDAVASYYKGDDGIWYLYLPGCGIANLARHEVTEHDDGSITAAPSILLDGHHNGRPTRLHGFLVKGFWLEA